MKEINKLFLTPFDHQMELTVEEVRDIEDPFFIFTFKYKGTTITMSDPSYCSPEDWKTFVDNLKNNQPDTLSFGGGNSTGEIFIKDDVVTFDVSISGSGGDMSIRLPVPRADCVSAFEEALKYF